LKGVTVGKFCRDSIVVRGGKGFRGPAVVVYAWVFEQHLQESKV